VQVGVLDYIVEVGMGLVLSNLIEGVEGELGMVPALLGFAVDQLKPYYTRGC
jgi:hypothetical protein